MTPTRKSSVSNRANAVSAAAPGASDTDTTIETPIGGSLNDILAMGDVSQSRAAVETTKRAAVRSTEDIASTIEKTGQTIRAGIRAKLMSADIESVRQLADDEEKDFAKALESLSKVAGQMDVEFQQLVEPTPEEKAIVEKAQSAVADLESQIARKKSQWNLFGMRDRALTTLQARLDQAKLDVNEAEVTMKTQMRQRLMSARMDKSIKVYVKVSNETVTLMVKRIGEVAQEVVRLNTERLDTLAQKEVAAKALTKVARELVELNLELQAAESLMQGLSNGTPEYATAEQNVSALRIKVQEKTGEKDVVMSSFQSKETAAARLELAQQAAISLKERHKARVARLTADTQARVHLYQNRLVVMKVMADQEFDEFLGQIGLTLDQQTSEYVASAMVAANEALMRTLEGQPERMEKVAATKAAIAEHLAKMSARGSRVDQLLADRYGISLSPESAFSWNTPAGDNGTGQPDAGAPDKAN